MRTKHILTWHSQARRHAFPKERAPVFKVGLAKIRFCFYFIFYLRYFSIVHPAHCSCRDCNSPPPQLTLNKMRTCISWKAPLPHQPSSDSMRAAPLIIITIIIPSSIPLLFRVVVKRLHVWGHRRSPQTVEGDPVRPRFTTDRKCEGGVMNAVSAWLSSWPPTALPFFPKLAMTLAELRWEKAAAVLRLVWWHARKHLRAARLRFMWNFSHFTVTLTSMKRPRQQQPKRDIFIICLYVWLSTIGIFIAIFCNKWL